MSVCACVRLCGLSTSTSDAHQERTSVKAWICTVQLTADQSIKAQLRCSRLIGTPMLQRLLPMLSTQVGPAGWPMLSYTCRGYPAVAASMSLVKDLREKSGAPISDVKSALVEANWDPGTSPAHAYKTALSSFALNKTSLSAAESAYQNLRKKGLAAASKKVWTACFLRQRRSWLYVASASPAAHGTHLSLKRMVIPGDAMH